MFCAPTIVRGLPLGPMSVAAPVTGTAAPSRGLYAALGLAYCIGWPSFSSRSSDSENQNLPMRFAILAV